MTDSLWEKSAEFFREKLSYSREQKRMLEERGDEFGQARDAYNRSLWEITQTLNRYGRTKHYVLDALEPLPPAAKTAFVTKAEERLQFQRKDGRPLERIGITGAALRDWAQRDLSYPDVAGLKPQDAFEIYDTLTENLRRESREMSAMCEPIGKWCDCAEGLLPVLKKRRSNPEKAKPVAKLLALFLEAELFVKRDTDYVFQAEKFAPATEAILAVLSAAEE